MDGLESFLLSPSADLTHIQLTSVTSSKILKLSITDDAGLVGEVANPDRLLVIF